MADDNTETFEKLNDYTLSVRTNFSHQKESDPTLRRIFNFRAQQITEIYSIWFNAAVTSSMTQTRFSELDSQDEVEMMRDKLRSMGGTPPDATTRRLPGKDLPRP